MKFIKILDDFKILQRKNAKNFFACMGIFCLHVKFVHPHWISENVSSFCKCAKFLQMCKFFVKFAIFASFQNFCKMCTCLTTVLSFLQRCKFFANLQFFANVRNFLQRRCQIFCKCAKFLSQCKFFANLQNFCRCAKFSQNV